MGCRCGGGYTIANVLDYRVLCVVDIYIPSLAERAQVIVDR